MNKEFGHLWRNIWAGRDAYTYGVTPGLALCEEGWGGLIAINCDQTGDEPLDMVERWELRQIFGDYMGHALDQGGVFGVDPIDDFQPTYTNINLGRVAVLHEEHEVQHIDWNRYATPIPEDIRREYNPWAPYRHYGWMTQEAQAAYAEQQAVLAAQHEYIDYDVIPRDSLSRNSQGI